MINGCGNYTVVKSTQPFINKWPWHMAFGSYMYMYDSRAMAESFRYHPTIIFFLQILPKGKQLLSDPSTNEWRECSCMIIQNIIFHLSQLLCLYPTTKICSFQKGGRVRIPSLSTLCDNRDQCVCLIHYTDHTSLSSLLAVVI